MLQTYSNIEYIIIDGNSTDRTLDIAKEYREKFADKKIIYIILSEDDNGIYDAMNKGINLAKGELIGIINSDDWYEADAIDSVVSEYINERFDLLFADMRIWRSNGKCMIKKAKLGKIITSRNWNHPTSFISRDVYNERTYACENLYDDFELYIWILKSHKRVVALNKILANFRIGGISNKKDLRAFFKRIKIRYYIYRKNNCSKWYLFECLFVEIGKYIFA